MRFYELIAAGAAEARRRKRWTQEDAARAFRDHGLTTWRTGNVGQLETGLRRPRLDDVLLIAAALDCTLNDLLPDTDEPIEMNHGATLPIASVRALLGQGLASPEVQVPGNVQAPDVPSDAERHAARRLDYHPAHIRLASLELWGREFRAERDARVGDTADMSASLLRARRRFATRAMMAEVGGFLATAVNT